MKITATEEYGMRCMLQLAAQDPASPLTLSEISRREGMSVPHVAKVMAHLRAGGLVDSVRGRSGGYVLSRRPEAISVLDVLAALGERLFDSEFCDRHHGDRHDACVHAGGCSIRSVWGSVESVVSDVLRRTSIAELIRAEERTLARALEDRSRSSRFVRLEPGSE